jgi:hypothetical protein
MGWYGNGISDFSKIDKDRSGAAGVCFTDHHSAARIDAMDLKNVLGRINSDRRNLVH